MIVTPVLALEEMRFPMEILAAALVYLLPFAEKKEHFAAKAAGWYVVFAMAALLYFPVFLDKSNPRFEYPLALWYSLFALCPVVYAKLCFEIGWCDALFLNISAFTTQNIVYSFVNLFLARNLVPELREHLLLYVLVSAAACGLVFGLAWRLFASHLSRCNNVLFEDTRGNLVFYCILFTLTIICLFYYQGLYEQVEGQAGRSSWLPGMMFSIFLLTVQYSMFRVKSVSTEYDQLEQILANSEHYYEMSKESIAIINRKCHDLKHQLKILSMVSEEERQRYIDEAREDLAFYQQLVHSENPVINTILAEKGLFCEERGITLSCAVDDVDLGFVKVTDLYAMLGNALDNAIEYVSKFDGEGQQELRVIDLRISDARGFVSIQVVNPYRGPALQPGELPKSSHEEDKGYHGFGLRSIRYIAQKYGGHMEISAADGLFTLQVLMPKGTGEPVQQHTV